MTGNLEQELEIMQVILRALPEGEDKRMFKEWADLIRKWGLKVLRRKMDRQPVWEEIASWHISRSENDGIGLGNKIWTDGMEELRRLAE
jgi:hypothetical protein